MRPPPPPTFSDRLLDVEHDEREHYQTGRDLVPVPLERCPTCDSRLELQLLRQDSLVRGGGYGGTRRVETWACTETECTFSRVVAVATERPPRPLSGGNGGNRT